MKRKKALKRKNPLIFIFCLLLASAILIYAVWKNTTKVQPTGSVATKQTIYPTQYSDTHITTNAIVSNKKFKDITFSNAESQTQNLANVLNSIQPTDIQRMSDTRPEKGTWLWTPILDITPAYRESIIANASQNGIRNIYLSIDSYLDIYVLPEGSNKNAKKKAFDKALADFIAKANEYHITVDAEAGWRNWAEKDNTYKALAVVDYAIQFNKTHTEKLRGFQYDVEPYLLDAYKKDKKTVLADFLDLVGNTVARLYGSDLALSVVIPEFYDGTNDETPAFSYAGKSGYATSHLLRILEKRAGSKIIVMSYRNFSTGDDGSIDVSRNEITEADTYHTKVVIAQETGDVLPQSITFHKTSRKYYDKQVGLIENAFAKDKSFGGIATHYVNAFLEL